MKKNWKAAAAALTLTLLMAAPAVAQGVYTDVFDWGMADYQGKVKIVDSLESILIENGIINEYRSSDQLIRIVDEQLRIDGEQALILDKLCLGLGVNCDSLLQ